MKNGRRSYERQMRMRLSASIRIFLKGSGAAGPQVFCRDREAAGYELAKYVQAALNEQLSIQNPRDVNTGDYQLLRPGSQASVIVECGFFSNPEEEQKLQKDDYQQKLAQAGSKRGSGNIFQKRTVKGGDKHSENSYNNGQQNFFCRKKGSLLPLFI